MVIFAEYRYYYFSYSLYHNCTIFEIMTSSFENDVFQWAFFGSTPAFITLINDGLFDLYKCKLSIFFSASYKSLIFCFLQFEQMCKFVQQENQPPS